jgi:hypothetical protein
LRRGSTLLAVAAAAVESLAVPDARADDTVTYEIREQITGALLTSHDYGVSGTCATGSGTVPASIYAQGGSGRGKALGPGVGGRVFYSNLAAPPIERSSTWWGFRMGIGLDIDLLYGRIDTGIPDMTGKLCARVKSDGADVQYRGSSVLFLQLPAFFGAEMAFNNTVHEDGSRHSIVLAAGWAPAMILSVPWVAKPDFDGSFLGTEVTLDFATWRPAPEHQERKRASIFLLLPPQDHGPAVITLSFGAVWN